MKKLYVSFLDLFYQALFDEIMFASCSVKCVLSYRLDNVLEIILYFPWMVECYEKKKKIFKCTTCRKNYKYMKINQFKKHV